jgi:hypothetical protein
MPKSLRFHRTELKERFTLAAICMSEYFPSSETSAGVHARGGRFKAAPAFDDGFQGSSSLACGIAIGTFPQQRPFPFLPAIGGYRRLAAIPPSEIG